MTLLITSAVEQLVSSGRAAQFVFLLIIGVVSYVSYELGKRGRIWEIRPLEGLEAVDEGIGRAAEMGRPILVLPGISNLRNAQTVAGLTMFGEVTQRAAEIGLDTHCIATSTEVVTAAEAVARDAYTRIGKPEMYTSGKYVEWYGGGQFVYAVGAAGHIMEMKPALLVYMGYFLADVIVTAETGARVGSISIGSTTDQSATPLMGMFCDYMLMGEEMYAASATITQNPLAIATLAGEDWIKLILLGLMVVGVLAYAAGNQFIWTLLGK
jgi:hypothetical protein